MQLVILESPYAGKSKWRIVAFFQRRANRRYARQCCRDALRRGEAPIASHLLYTQRGILRDGVPAERKWGINAGLSWRNVASATVVYVDRGVSRGMQMAIDLAKVEHRALHFRCFDPLRGLDFVRQHPLEDIDPGLAPGAPGFREFWLAAAQIRRENLKREMARKGGRGRFQDAMELAGMPGIVRKTQDPDGADLPPVPVFFGIDNATVRAVMDGPKPFVPTDAEAKSFIEDCAKRGLPAAMVRTDVMIKDGAVIKIGRRCDCVEGGEHYSCTCMRGGVPTRKRAS